MSDPDISFCNVYIASFDEILMSLAYSYSETQSQHVSPSYFFCHANEISCLKELDSFFLFEASTL